MSSLRKPKRITFRGDDSREYKFLVKGSEDLRMDQRIEQVCEKLNGENSFPCLPTAVNVAL